MASEYQPKLGNDGGQHQVLVRGVNHFFGTGENRKQGLFENNLTLMPGEIVIMTGPSGSGKTTLLTLIGALRTLQEGSLHVMDRELQGLSPIELTRVRRSIGFIFQAHNLFESLTAFQNVRMALELKIEQYSSREMKRLAEEMLTRLGLGERIHYKPRHLSGGQRQRVAIARALVNRPRLVLADEPTAALDKGSASVVMELLGELAHKDGSTVLIVTHDKRVIDAADRIVTMVDGAIASEIMVEETVTICEFLAQCPSFKPDSEISQSVYGSSEGGHRLAFSSSPAMLTKLAQKMRKQKYAAGSTIIREGDQGDTFYIIRDGSVDIVKGDRAAGGKVATLGMGSYFGEAALISDEQRNASAIAMQDTVVYSLNKADFLAAISASGSFDDQLRGQMFQS